MRTGLPGYVLSRPCSAPPAPGAPAGRGWDPAARTFHSCPRMKYLFDNRNSMIFSFHGLTRAAGSRGTAESRWAQMKTLSKELRPTAQAAGEASSDQREEQDDKIGRDHV